MEPITIFAASIGLVGVCRLTFAAVDYLGKGIYSTGSSPAKRDEWYCFFKPSDLRIIKKQHQTTIIEDSLERRRRTQQRPRLRAERNFR